jgi:hypothetical protein
VPHFVFAKDKKNFSKFIPSNQTLDIGEKENLFSSIENPNFLAQ